jgi:senataxin
MSDREAEILKQQRLVAAKLAASNKNGTQHKTSNNAASKRPVSSNKQASIVQQKNQRTQLSSLLKLPASSTSKPTSSIQKKRPSQKRPTLKKSRPTPPMTAAAAIAAAKSRVATATKEVISKAQGKHTFKTPSTDSTSFVARKTSQLKQLVSASMKSNDDDTPILTGSFPQVSPDDFMKHFRDWDVLTQLCESQYRENEDTSPLSKKKPLPDTFVSHGHYIAAWAPLCLAEARAQVVNDYQAYKKKKQFLPVSVKTAVGNDSGGSTLESMRVQVFRKIRQEERDSEYFMPNDLVLLIPTKSKALVEKALDSSNTTDNTTSSSLRKHGLIGQVEYRRDGVDGLLLRVSKRWWATVGQDDMELLKLGSNITAVREFTALCRVETLPLKRFILGEHLQDKPAAATSSSPNDSPGGVGNAQAMLESMGGSDALGKGFISYIKNKFNPSQLAAISAAAQEYGDGGFTLCKGPPGTGKTSTLVAILNSLHIRQFNKYYDTVRRVAATTTGNRNVKLGNAVKCKPRLLVCAPSNAAVDNVILKIMQDGFVDGSGKRYNPSIIRVGVGKSDAVRDVALENQVNAILAENMDMGRLETTISGYKMELQRIQTNLARLRKRVHALAKASPWPLSKDWEIRIDENTFEETGRVYFVNHREKKTSYQVPPPPEPGEKQYLATAMPEYRSYMQQIVKLVENFNSITTKLERCTIIQNGGSSRGGSDSIAVRQQLETHILDTVHIVCTTLGTAGNRVLESAAKFEVVVVDEAAQSTEPATLAALQLGSRHAVLVGDPQQLPATIFNVSGRNTKYDRSLFQRMEEAGQKVYMLNLQYRMHPLISDFPRSIFYGGNLLDAPNVLNVNYGNPLRQVLCSKAQAIKPFTLFDLDSKEHRDGTSLANKDEARLAVHLYTQLRQVTNGLSASQTRVAVITPYAQQANLLRKCFAESLGGDYEQWVEVNTVDGYQGRESNIVIFSCVRAAGSQGVGFLSDVRRMNVALTRAKFFLFVIARCESIVVNPYWRDLVDHARDTQAVVTVPMKRSGNDKSAGFPDLVQLKRETDGGGTTGGKKRKRNKNESNGQGKPPGRPKETH